MKRGPRQFTQRKQTIPPTKSGEFKKGVRNLIENEGNHKSCESQPYSDFPLFESKVKSRFRLKKKKKEKTAKVSEYRNQPYELPVHLVVFFRPDVVPV